MTTTEAPTSTTNALSVLLSAVPSDVAASFESAFDSLTSRLLAASSHQASSTTTTSISATTTQSNTPSTTPTILSISSTESSLSLTPTPSTFSTVSSRLTSFSSTAPPTTSVTTASTNGGQLKNASIAGIATGVAAGAVLLILAGAYLFRRRQLGKPLFGRGGSRRSNGSGGKRVFPEVAWLYDPRMSPRQGSPTREVEERAGLAHASHSRNNSSSSMNHIPEPREGVAELASAPASPQLHPRPTSPLLAPAAPYVRGQSPQGRPRSGSASPRRSGSSSPGGRRSRSSFGASRTDLSRPMSAIYEEPPRPSVDARQGLLAPESINTQRHSA
ncbi:hypothetical protein BAUCODRAFT_199488 [Baudoinia panamericana UAMH 10762]|uniref:Mid2 domain-containing protein n=1 Tax=Baudoinia panamericana (strain UAMH 10762) TaxID=717646 RepID=M2NNQ0_BAUPA|nr:uncharacterized protein BAUCODRAFT_199488 [Baudoinia panamericana UAMH 10762]EMD01150.1 hypothetical protein BAUCODRAFT_199488 [Baudoinia panamericana UAMH 10762]